ncbi:hypothetical protein ACFVTY_03310 [Streptomyces sp. NPDC058067]|uniref:hypothetical protein n=1 Tax=Streptomyces sp. NPDC058067 TaxID=3346324 RepID=UPI0036E8702C
MALRARPASTVPETLVDTIATRIGFPLRDSAERGNRLIGLAAVTGIAVGCGTGAAVALVHRAGARMPLWLGGPLTGALVMVVADVPIARLGVSDPHTWSVGDWASDVVPHLIFGLVTYGLVTAWDH